MASALSKIFAALLLAGAHVGAAWAFESPGVAASAAGFEPAACDFKDAPPEWAQANGATCGYVSVPARRNRPEAGSLKLWVVKLDARRKASSTPVIRVLGGPEPIRFAYLTGPRTTRLRQDRDVVFFDYRSLGNSDPKLACQVDPVRGDTMAARLTSKLDQYAKCRDQIAAAGGDLAQLSSLESARDIDDIARALDYDRYYLSGGSYGSITMMELMRRQPAGLRAAVIGTPFPPNTPLHDTVSSFALSLDQMQVQCDRNPDCARRFPDMAGALGKAMERLEREQWSDRGRRLRAPDLLESLWGLMFGNDFQLVPLAIDVAAHGDAQVAASWIGATSGGADFFLPELTEPASITSATVNCADISNGRPIAPDLRAAAARFPHLARALAPAEGFDRLCATLLPELAEATQRAAVVSDVPVLMFTLHFDPTTTPSDGRLAAQTLKNATLLEHPGGTHMTLVADACLIAMESAFFADPRKPIDRTCTEGWKPAVFEIDGFTEHVKATVASP